MDNPNTDLIRWKLTYQLLLIWSMIKLFYDPLFLSQEQTDTQKDEALKTPVSIRP